MTPVVSTRSTASAAAAAPAASAAGSPVRRARRRRWTVVALSVAVLVVLPGVVSAFPVPSSGLSPAQVVSAARGSALVAHQGLVEVDGRLGLPDLPIFTGAAPLLDASTTLRTWWRSESSWRTDTLTNGGQEQEFATTGGTLTWDFEDDEATFRPTELGPRLPRPTDLLPPTAARLLLGWIGPADTVAGLPTQRVAGVAAQGASVVPTDPRTSVSHLDMWVDPRTGLPLRVDVFARGAVQPAFTSRFLDLDLALPTDDALAPTLSPTVPRSSSPRRDILTAVSQSATQTFPATLATLPSITGVAVPIDLAVYGEGFARVAVIRLPERLLPRILDSVSAGGQTTRVAGGRVAMLPGSLLQVALLVSDAGPGYLLVATLTPGAMADVVAAAARVLPAGVSDSRATP